MMANVTEPKPATEFRLLNLSSQVRTAISPGDEPKSACEPQRISNGLEHSPLMVRSQNAIPAEDGWRFHGRRESLVSRDLWIVK